jgi:hypothetical protein
VAPKSAGGAVALSLVVPGLGHVYVGEGWRGAVYIICFALAVLGAFATDTIGPAPIVGIISMVDAYRGATQYNSTGATRGVTAGVWLLLTVLVLVVSIAVAKSDSGSGDNGCRVVNGEVVGC